MSHIQSEEREKVQVHAHRVWVQLEVWCPSDVNGRAVLSLACRRFSLGFSNINFMGWVRCSRIVRLIMEDLIAAQSHTHFQAVLGDSVMVDQS
jgi:hypothetical protein